MVWTWVVGGEEIQSGFSTPCLDWEVGRVRGAGTCEDGDGDGEDVDVGERGEAGTWSQWEERWDWVTGPPTRKSEESW
jgi:hypothetical protein